MNPATRRVPAFRMVTSTPVLPNIRLGKTCSLAEPFFVWLALVLSLEPVRIRGSPRSRPRRWRPRRSA